jgi:hypothetical protein
MTAKKRKSLDPAHKNTIDKFLQAASVLDSSKTSNKNSAADDSFLDGLLDKVEKR